MAQDFLNKSPVGTVVFNRENQLHYIKVKENGRTFWKIQRGSRLGSLLIDSKKDVKGKPYTYIDKDGVKQTGQQGDDIPDYLQNRGFWQSDKYFVKENNYIIKDGKYFLPDGTEIKDHKFKQGQTYHIDSLNSQVGKSLQTDLADTDDFRTYQRTNARILERDALVASLKKLQSATNPKVNTINSLKKQINNIESKYNLQGVTVKPWVAPSKRNDLLPGKEVKKSGLLDQLLLEHKQQQKIKQNNNVPLPWEQNMTNTQKQNLNNIKQQRSKITELNWEL